MDESIGIRYSNAVAEITRLRAERDQLNAFRITEHAAHAKLIAELTEKCDSLRAEIAECRRDAARYRWLRLELPAYNHIARSPAGLDHAIDGALAAEGDTK